jgi:glycosyltransferase involved in cell wall biosynthesis
MPHTTLMHPHRHGSETRPKGRSGNLARPRRILIDCSTTYRYDLGGGIQRVVRNLVNSADALGREMKLVVQPVIYDPVQGFRAVASLPVPFENVHTATFVRAATATTAGPTSTDSSLSRTRDRLRCGLRSSLASLGLLESARRAKYLVRNSLARARYRRVQNGDQPLEIGPGDVLLLPDMTWDTLGAWESALAVQQAGAKVAAVVYDLIPLRFSHLCAQPFVEAFRGWWESVRRRADIVVCISNSVWEDVQNYVAPDPAREAGRPPLRGGSFRLGAGLDLDFDHSAIRSQLRQLFGADPLDNPYLMAASFHVRKNHRVVLEAFDRLWARDLRARLVIVARKYHNQPLPLTELVEKHPEFNRRLFWFYDMEDGELDYCYRRSAALITASYAEGFNLPIVESLSRGRPVLASDIPIHREVAGPHAAYFAPRSSDALADLLLRYQSGDLRSSLKPLEGFHWPNWFESGRELLERVVELYPEVSEPAAGQSDQLRQSA